MSYKKIVYKDNEFTVIFEDGTLKGAGPNLQGMIRYTYFEDYSYPPDGWEVERETLMKDYFSKLMPDIMSGKISPLNSSDNLN